MEEKSFSQSGYGYLTDNLDYCRLKKNEVVKIKHKTESLSETHGEEVVYVLYGDDYARGTHVFSRHIIPII